jgi:hypothetical protein
VVGVSEVVDRKTATRQIFIKLKRAAFAGAMHVVVRQTLSQGFRSPDGWKLCLRDKDLNELYNLNEDPCETRNLYSDAQYASVVSRFASEIYRWQEATSDKLKL